MGKDLIQQRRGKGSPIYKANSFTWKGKIEHASFTNKTKEGVVKELIHCRGHSAPIIKVTYENEETFLPAPLGIKEGDKIFAGSQVPLEVGNVLPLREIPEGTLVFNIENKPGDGGKLVRAAGTYGRIITKLQDAVIVVLPSKKKKAFSPMCRACIGVVSGGGKKEKPLVKAGNMYFKKKAKNKLWPVVSGCAMNAVDHPYGCKRSSRKGRPTIAPKNAPPGRKVGMIRPRKSGRGQFLLKKRGGTKKSKTKEKEKKE